MQRTPCSKAAIAPPRLGAILSGSTTGEAEDRVLSARGEMQPDAKQRIAEIERRQKAIREKLGPSGSSISVRTSIDIDTYDRHRDKLRRGAHARADGPALVGARGNGRGSIWRSQSAVVPSASNLWVIVRSEQRLQQMFFPDGVRFDGKGLVGTGTTLPGFQLLEPVSQDKNELVDQSGASWNRVAGWLRQVDRVKGSPRFRPIASRRAGEQKQESRNGNPVQIPLCVAAIERVDIRRGTDSD
jgi:hypothetical protein